MYDLKDKKVLVVGLGRSGVAAAGFAAHRGARVTVTDAKDAAELGEQLAALAPCGVALHLGGHEGVAFDDFDLVVASPGVPTDLAGIVAARARGVPVVGEMELALGEIDKPIVAVTGTNGKTTVTELIGHLMNACGISVCVAGNIGTPLASVVPRARAADWVVLEISSFQLETTPSLAAAIAVWLNVTPDHLDRHASFDEYVATKARLFTPLSSESWGIYNSADDVVAASVMTSRAHLVPYDAAGVRTDGGWYEDGDLHIDIPGRGRYRFSLDGVALEGRHNRENMLAAIIATIIAGGTSEAIQAGLRTFRGLPHRLEFAGETRGVRFYDDSKGTNVGATIRALDSFAEPVVLIAGGQAKGADFSPLVPWLKKSVKKLILIGEAAELIRKAADDVVPVELASDMDEAVNAAWRAADPGDVVLLSPACASFDMFRDYAHRGEEFKQAVGRLAATGRKRRQ